MKISTATLFSISLAGGEFFCLASPYSLRWPKGSLEWPFKKPSLGSIEWPFKKPSLRFWRKTTDNPNAVPADISWKFSRENEDLAKKDNVGDIIKGMIKISDFVYTYGSVRKIVFKHDKTIQEIRGNLQGKSKDSKHIVEFDSPDLVREMFENERVDKIRYLKEPINASRYLEFLRRNRKYFNQAPDGSTMKFNFNYKNSPELGCQSPFEKMIAKFAKIGGRLLDMDDESTLEGGLVYGILSNRLKRRAIVVFRGTVGGVDIPTCANFSKNDRVFKCKDHDGLDIKVHSGFASYLFNKIDGVSKYDRIIACLKYFHDTIPDDLKDDYELYVTGHSLGGSLSNMFAFAAAHEEKDHPLFKKIRVVTFASPVVGNMGYNKAFQKLERLGRLSLLRISNKGDVICTRPLPGYTQNGVNMHLLRNGKEMQLKYRNTKGLFTQVCPDALKCHSFPEYEQRLFSPAHSDILERSYEEIMLTGDDFTE